MQQPILLELEAPIKVCWRVVRKHAENQIHGLLADLR